MKDFDKRMRFIQLRAENKSYSKICRELGISKGTCSSWNKELQDEIRQFREEHLKELYDQYYLMRSDRIEALAKKVKKLEEEIEARPVSEISTENLWRLYRQFYDMLKREIIELKTEQWEKSLGALVFDKDLEESLRWTELMFTDADRKIYEASMDTILEIGERHENNHEISEMDRIKYRDAVQILNKLYRRYSLPTRMPIIFDMIPITDQRLFESISKTIGDIQKKIGDKSLLNARMNEDFRQEYLKTMELRAKLLENYGLFASDIRIFFDEMQEIRERILKSHRESNETEK